MGKIKNIVTENVGFEYIVKPGDSITKISEMLNIDWEKLAADNKIEAPYELFIGQKLIINEDSK